jgi:hypothetical protein
MRPSACRGYHRVHCHNVVGFPLPSDYWSGMVEFAVPITVILTQSLFMALIFIPVVGGLIGKRAPQTA